MCASFILTPLLLPQEEFIDVIERGRQKDATRREVNQMRMRLGLLHQLLEVCVGGAVSGE